MDPTDLLARAALQAITDAAESLNLSDEEDKALAQWVATVLRALRQPSGPTQH